MFREPSHRVPWGPADERGALNYLTTERVVAATRPVRDDMTVTLIGVAVLVMLVAGLLGKFRTRNGTAQPQAA